jgi:hypothetical protein
MERVEHGSPDPDLRALIDRIPGAAGRPLTVIPLDGGLTNRNHHLRPPDGDPGWVLRSPGAGTDLLGIDREQELAASLAAAHVGVGPDVITLLRPEGALVTRFIPGRAVPEEDLRSGAAIPRVASALRAIHGATPVTATFRPLEVVIRYRQLAATRGVRPPVDAAPLDALIGELDRALRAVPVADRLCHNDLLNANLIDDGTRIRIVDWEYAAMGDPWFDLGNLSANHGLGEDVEEALLDAWLGRAHRPGELGRLRVMRVVSDLREGMWGVLQSAVSTLPVDFRAYAAEHLGRALDRGATHGLRTALVAIATDPVPAGDPAAR